MKAILLCAAVISFNVAANLLMKLGSGDGSSPLLLGLMSWRTALGLATFACAAICYAVALRFLPLNLVQSYAAAQFTAVILASRVVLGESIASMRWLGISIITVGIVVVATSQDAP